MRRFTQNIFRFLSYLEAAGPHRQDLPLLVAGDPTVDARSRARDGQTFQQLPVPEGPYALYDPKVGVGDDVDAIFATSQETTYPVPGSFQRSSLLLRTGLRRPSFYPVGSNQLAEDTCRFGFEAFTAIVAGRELHDEVRRDGSPLRLRRRDDALQAHE